MIDTYSKLVFKVPLDRAVVSAMFNQLRSEYPDTYIYGTGEYNADNKFYTVNWIMDAPKRLIPDIIKRLNELEIIHYLSY